MLQMRGNRKSHYVKMTQIHDLEDSDGKRREGFQGFHIEFNSQNVTIRKNVIKIRITSRTTNWK